VLAALLLGARRRAAREQWVAAAFGAVTALFDLLTGPLVVGAMLVGLFAATRRAERSPISPLRHAWGTLLAYLAAFAVVMGLQSLVASIATGRNAFHDVWVHLAIRLQLHHAVDVGVPDLWRTATNLASYGPTDVLARVGEAVPSLVYGSTAGAVAVSLVACAAMVAGAWVAWRSRDAELRATVIALGSLLPVVPAWYLAFANHTAIHALYMVRLVTTMWLCAVAIGLVAGVAVHRSRAIASEPTPAAVDPAA
jgi:hypothetical protein